ncbi:MAG: hypothetical protein J6B95_03070 [Oscillospiraceae bacterium]|nr:hypothetical protein [Oscillospiraceae bacterium]
MAKKRRKYEFKPDPKGTNLLKVLHMTRHQQLQTLKWALYALLCLVLLIVQDVVMSRFRFSGATTDLAVCGILLIGILAGAEDGGLFALLASAIYWFSGSAPGPYVIALITLFVIGASLFRQVFWHRSFGSIMLCAGLAMMLYEWSLFAIGIFIGRTLWARFGVFTIAGVMSVLVMLALYPLVKAIGKIGGETWKE